MAVGHARHGLSRRSPGGAAAVVPG
jgi:hypothetical protein